MFASLFSNATSYGTGCFMLMNTGTQCVASSHGLLTTVAYRLGADAPTHYALEGAIAIAGAGVKFVVNNLGLVKDVAEFNAVAAAVDDAHGVVFVPAFTGLLAPHWRDDARGIIGGMTQYTQRGHICRALLDGVAWQTVEVYEAMRKDMGGRDGGDGGDGGDDADASPLKVDGGMTRSSLLLRVQANALARQVVRPANEEVTALGAALAAAHAVGVIGDLSQWVAGRDSSDDVIVGFDETASKEQRGKKLQAWKAAVERSFGPWPSQ